ncbi:asparaginyl-tRNA synthetase-like [Diadema antillarum]|uniref:asparaginyl-tRNA synthetase-like n=1 Tax=Diadema antillarum TaxID=105358 RepID=UPI003A86B057
MALRRSLTDSCVGCLSRCGSFPRLFVRDCSFARRTCTSFSKSSVASIFSGKGDIGKNIETKAWVKGQRVHKDVMFLDINDGSCSRNLQVVAKPHVIQDSSKHQLYGSSVEVKGQLVESKSKGQDIELQASSVNITGPCNPESYPFKAKTRHPAEYTRQFPHLRSRTPNFAALTRLRSSVTAAVHAFFQDQGYVNVHTPILTASDCEGAGEMFSVRAPGDNDETEGDHFFGVPVHLTVSGQLQLEAVACSHSKAYTFGPTFRAEKSRTRRHLAEFYMVEAELAFTQSLGDITQVMEEFVKSVADSVYTRCSEDVQCVTDQNVKGHLDEVQRVLAKPFQTLSYTDAISILEKHQDEFQFPPSWGIDLQTEHERFLVQHCDGVPVFVTDFPAEIKPFYSRDNGDGRTAAAVDLLVPGVGELIGGSLREERLEVLQHRLQGMGLEDEYQWYLDLRRFGSVPHGGFGLGFERLLQFLLGVEHIQDVIPFPRLFGSCKM